MSGIIKARISRPRIFARISGARVTVYSGGSGDSYTHAQTLPQSTWTINHGLGRHPTVTFRDTAGASFMAAYEHVSDDQVIATFTNPISGYADCT